MDLRVGGPLAGALGWGALPAMFQFQAALCISRRFCGLRNPEQSHPELPIFSAEL